MVWEQAILCLFTLLWEDANYSVSSSPAIVNDVIYTGSWNGNVYALNATNGAKLWSYYIGVGAPSLSAIPPPAFTSSPAVVNGIVYVGSFDDNVYALNATSGDKLWNYTTGGAVASSPTVVNGEVYVGSDDGNVYALNAISGYKLWSHNTGNWGVSSPAVVGGVVYIGSWDHNVYALNATNGDKLWSYPMEIYVQSSPSVIGGDSLRRLICCECRFFCD